MNTLTAPLNSQVTLHSALKNEAGLETNHGSVSENTPLQVVVVASRDTGLLLEAQLQRAGCEVATEVVTSARALRAQLSRSICCLLLLEYSSVLSLEQVLEILSEQNCDASIILITDASREAEAVETMQSGVRDYLLTDNLVRLGQVVTRELEHLVTRREQHRAEAALLVANAVLGATQEATGEGTCLVSNEGKIVSSDAAFAELWQIEPEQTATPHNGERLFSQVLAQMRDPGEWPAKIQDLLNYPANSTQDEVLLKDGRTFERRSSAAVAPSGQILGRIWAFRDITPHKNYQIQLAHQAFHDPVTGLPNRALFLDRLERTVARVRRSSRSAAVLFLDLDRFKVVNDSLGHAKGDELLSEVASRLSHCLRPGDTAARFGGDEFTVLLEDISSTHDAVHVAERVAHAISTPFLLGTQEVHVSASIGIVTAGRDADSADELLRKADVAMYRAKQKGRAQYAIFDTQMSAQAMARLQMEVDLRRAIKSRQLLLHFQPIVDLQRGRVMGTEALVRWEHPTRGLVPPFEFVSLAEEIGMILPIGQWVLREACSWTRAWQEQYSPESQGISEPMVPGAPAVPGSPAAPGARVLQSGAREVSGKEGAVLRPPTPLTVSVNLSARQFRQPDLVDEIARVLKETELPPACLMLEITESTVMDDITATIAQLEALKKLGVLLAVDDFGTGYSSLAYLESFPLDCLKVDRAFVSRVGERGERLAIVQAICNLGYALGMKVTAEGLETSGQVSQLRRIGCRAGQGYYFSRPLPADEMTALLERNPQW